MPTRNKISGLYPFLGDTLPILQRAFLDQGVSVRFFFYLRAFLGWLQSLHTYKYPRNRKPFKPEKFRAKHDLPGQWDEVKTRLVAALGETNVVFQGYETDRATRRFGTALFRAFGLDEDVLQSFKWIAPVNEDTP